MNMTHCIHARLMAFSEQFSRRAMLLAAFAALLGCDAPKSRPQPGQVFPNLQPGPSCLACSPDGRTIVTGSRRGNVMVWDATQLKLARTMESVKDINALAYSRDGNSLAVGTTDTLQVLNTKEWKPLRRFHTQDYIHVVAFAKNDRILIAAGEKVVFWDTTSGQCLATMPTQPGVINALAVSPNGDVVAVADSRGEVRLYDPATQKELCVLEHSRRVAALAFSPDGQRLAAAGDGGTFSVWNPTTGKELASWVGHEECGVLAMVFVSNTVIASSGLDRLTTLSDARTGRKLHSCNCDPHSSVYYLAFCPTTNNLVILSGVGYLMMVKPPSEQ